MVIGAFVQDGAEFLFVNYRRFSQFCKDFPPGNEKKKNKTKQNKIKQTKKMLSIWIENFKVLFLRNSRELGFLCDCIIGVCSLNVLKNLNVIVLNALH